MTSRFPTLQRTLSIHFVLVAVFPIFFFGVVATSLFYQHLQNEIYQSNRARSEDIAAATEQFLAETERDLQILGEAINSEKLAGSDAIDHLLGLVVGKTGYFESIYLIDARFRVTHLGLNAHHKLQREDYRGIDYSQHELFREGGAPNVPAWSGTFVSLVSGDPSVSVALPLGDGRFLLANVSLHQLSTMLARYSRSQADRQAIVDQSGTLVAHSDVQLALQRVNFFDHRSVSLALQGHGQTLEEDHEHGKVLESTSVVPRTRWVAWVGVDMQTVMAPFDHFRHLLIAGMLLALALAAALAFFDARRLMRPLAVLNRSAGQIGAGNYSFALTPSGFAEIDQLAGSLTTMANAVSDRERSLIASEQRFRDLVNSIEGVVWEMDLASGRYLFVSQRVQTLLGYSCELWQENPGFWASLIHPEDVGRVVAGGRRNLALTDKQDIEYRLFDSHGNTLWVRDLVNTIRDGDEPRRLLGVMVDATERKHAEEELARYRARLEELVAERTRQLEQAQAELVYKERLVVLGQLTATVSHEIRNPLGTVANSLYAVREMLGDECLEQIERPLALAERNVQRCDEIISELLDFTRRRKTQTVVFDLDGWLGELLSEMTWPDGLERCWRLASEVEVRADPERLRRALINVITNALQSIDERGTGNQRLEVSTRRSAERCEIVVRDNGMGIPEEIRERIFEPLFSTKNFGVGLGVPIIKNIMEDHGGGVSYQSAVGEGTTVTLWLPLAAPESSPPVKS